MEIVTHFYTLIIYARELAEAEKRGNKDEIERAKKKHEYYRQACLKSDRMIINKPDF